MHPVSIHSTRDCAISGTTGWAFSWTSPLSPGPCWLHRLPVRLYKVNQITFCRHGVVDYNVNIADVLYCILHILLHLQCSIKNAIEDLHRKTGIHKYTLEFWQRKQHKCVVTLQQLKIYLVSSSTNKTAYTNEFVHYNNINCWSEFMTCVQSNLAKIRIVDSSPLANAHRYVWTQPPSNTFNTLDPQDLVPETAPRSVQSFLQDSPFTSTCKILCFSMGRTTN